MFLLVWMSLPVLFGALNKQSIFEGLTVSIPEIKIDYLDMTSVPCPLTLGAKAGTFCCASPPCFPFCFYFCFLRLSAILFPSCGFWCFWNRVCFLVFTLLILHVVRNLPSCSRPLTLSFPDAVTPKCSPLHCGDLQLWNYFILTS